MKKLLLSSIAISIFQLAGTLAFPNLAQATALSLVSGASGYSTSQSGPSNSIDLIANFLGYYPNLTGPGGALTGVSFNATETRVIASASSLLNVAWYQVWDYGDTQTATQRFFWTAIYELNGVSGWSADINLNYVYDNSRLNLVFDGRSESKSSVGLYYDIVSSDLTDNYSQNAGDALQTFLGFGGFPWLTPTSPQRWDYDALGSLSYDANYHFAAMTWADDSQTGRFHVGTMGVGDQLYLSGGLLAESQAQAYAMGVEIATMVSSLRITLDVRDLPPTPIPEPGSLQIIGLGIAILGLYRRRKLH